MNPQKMVAMFLSLSLLGGVTTAEAKCKKHERSMLMEEYLQAQQQLVTGWVKGNRQIMNESLATLYEAQTHLMARGCISVEDSLLITQQVMKYPDRPLKNAYDVPVLAYRLLTKKLQRRTGIIVSPQSLLGKHPLLNAQKE